MASHFPSDHYSSKLPTDPLNNTNHHMIERQDEQGTQETPVPIRQHMLLLGMSIIGIGASLVGMWGTIFISWIPSLIPNERWAILVVGITLLSLAVAWIGSELPRMYALLGEQRRVNDREIALRAQLQDTYDEQEILVRQQQVLLAEVDRLYREQSKAAVTDAITGLPNHRAVMGRIEEELARCRRTQGSCAMLFVDLDHFKHVNDTWGHRAGDAILRQIATRLHTALRVEDFIGRYGGEEFAIVLTDVEVTGASQTSERLRHAIASEPCIWLAEDMSSTASLTITASIGVAIYALHGVTRELLIEHADHAMYQAKHTGRNRVCVADVDTPSEQEPGSTSVPAKVPEINTVQALTAAASARDRGTDHHAHRMVMLSEATARVLHLSEDEIHLIRLGALLHDIGKIGIPDAILHKSGPLTAEEWAIMRCHPEIGHQILMQTGGVFVALARIVVAHHERWDGRGYPAGIAHEEIPMASRILSVVDSYDAMISRRVYKEPKSVAEACAELRRCAGSQYDPQVVEAFLQALEAYKHSRVEPHSSEPEHIIDEGHAAASAEGTMSVAL